MWLDVDPRCGMGASRIHARASTCQVLSAVVSRSCTRPARRQMRWDSAPPELLGGCFALHPCVPLRKTLPNSYDATVTQQTPPTAVCPRRTYLLANWLEGRGMRRGILGLRRPTNVSSACCGRFLASAPTARCSCKGQWAGRPEHVTPRWRSSARWYCVQQHESRYILATRRLHTLIAPAAWRAHRRPPP